jgi:hypothetical protein
MFGKSIAIDSGESIRLSESKAGLPKDWSCPFSGGAIPTADAIPVCRRLVR